MTCERANGTQAWHGMMGRPVTDKDDRPLSHSSCGELVHELPHSAPQRQALTLQQCNEHHGRHSMLVIQAVLNLSTDGITRCAAHASEVAVEPTSLGQVKGVGAAAVCDNHQKQGWHRGLKDSVSSKPSWWQGRHAQWRAARLQNLTPRLAVGRHSSWHLTAVRWIEV